MCVCVCVHILRPVNAFVYVRFASSQHSLDQEEQQQQRHPTPSPPVTDRFAELSHPWNQNATFSRALSSSPSGVPRDPEALTGGRLQSGQYPANPPTAAHDQWLHTVSNEEEKGWVLVCAVYHNAMAPYIQTMQNTQDTGQYMT